MSEYKFSEAQKVSIWRADAERCFYCRIPVAYADLHVDHIVPEKVPTGKWAELQPLLGPQFDINSIANWVTCHQGCNIRKSVYVFETRTTLFYVEMARKRAPTVQKILDEFEVEKENGNLLSRLKVRLENGYLSEAAILALLGDLPIPARTGSDPWVVAFGSNFQNALPVGTPARDPLRSDWLQERLGRDLAATGAVFRKIDDERSGEGTSVRYAFWLVDLDHATESIDACWDVLTVQRYSELFQTPADDLLDRAVVSRYHQIVHNAPIGDPIGLSACPNCGSIDLKYASFSKEEDTIYEVTCNECGERTTT